MSDPLRRLDMPALTKSGLHPMAHLKQQLKDALSSIEPRDENAKAPEAPCSVPNALVAGAEAAAYGAYPDVTGAYKRRKTIKGVKSEAVLVRLPGQQRTDQT